MLGFISSYKSNKLNFWLEFLLDDFQIDDENYKGIKEKEPTEFAVILGSEFNYKKSSLLLNFTVIRNRTYNDEVELLPKVEKWISKLNDAQAETVFMLLNTLKDYGHQLRMPIVKKNQQPTPQGAGYGQNRVSC